MSKINKKDFIFDKKQNETLIKVPGQINGRDFVISNLEGCEVYLMDHIAQIFVDDCKNCTIHIGPVESSIFIRDCQDLKVSAACSQYRISDSSNIDSYVYAMTDPTLEKCRNVRFAPYNFAYPGQNEHFEKAKLDPKTNKWSQIFDFNENKQDPNWFILPPEEYPGPVQKTVDDLEAEPENPVEVNVEYGGTLNEPIIVGSQEAGVGGQEEQGGMMAFDIHTGAQQAAETFEQQAQEPVEAYEAHEVHEEVHEEAHEQREEYHHEEQPQEHHHEEQQPQEHHHEEEQPQEHHHEEQQHYDQGGHEEQQHFEPPQDQGYGYEHNQDFGQPQAQDFGAHDQGDFGYQSQPQVDSTNYQSQPAAADYDDFFGGSGQASQPQAVESTQYTTSSHEPVYQAPVSQPVYEAPVSQPAYGSYGQQAYGGEYDPEEEERLERLRRLEQERFRKLEEKARIERERKQERIANGARELNKFHSEREQQINKRKELNKQNQEIQSQAAQEEYKNPWDKIVANIATKEGEYPGTKDVTRFRQALINKKMDAAKGLNTGMPDF